MDKIGRIISVHPDYMDNFLLRMNAHCDLKKPPFLDTGTEFYGMKVLTSKLVPRGEVWLSNKPLREGVDYEEYKMPSIAAAVNNKKTEE